MPFSDAFLEEVRARASIAAYAGGKLSWDKGKTNRARGDFWACCPFHHEKSPSFHVLDGKGIYKCFGCGAAGNIFGLVQALEGVSFREAVERLAESCGLALPEEGSGPDPAEAARRARARQALDRAQALFARALASPAGAPARSYLERRGLDGATVERFGIGYALDGWSHLGDALRQEGFTHTDLINAGLVTPGEGGKRSVDVFRNRLMFPIHDAAGKLAGFGGRALAEGEKAKYLNSPDGPLFHKGRLLYRLEAARRTLAQQKGAHAHTQGLVVAEGYLDVIALERAGVPAVAPLGTALTEDQLQLLWKSGGSPLLCFDGDAAGQKAAARALRLALPHLGPDRTVRVLTLPEGQDPDDVYRAKGPEALVRLLADAQPAVAALFAQERDQGPIDTPEAKAGLKKRLQRVANTITDPDTQKAYFSDLMARAQELLNPPRQPSTPDTRPRPPAPGFGPSGRRSPWAPPPVVTQELREKENARKAAGPHGQAAQIEQLLIGLIDHPGLLEGVTDRLVELDIADPELAAVRDAAISCLCAAVTVDRGAVNNHLTTSGALRAAERMARWSPRTKAPDGEATAILEAELMALLDDLTVKTALDQELDDLRRLVEDGDDEAMRRVMALEAARRQGLARALARSAGLPPDADA